MIRRSVRGALPFATVAITGGSAVTGAKAPAHWIALSSAGESEKVQLREDARALARIEFHPFEGVARHVDVVERGEPLVGVAVVGSEDITERRRWIAHQAPHEPVRLAPYRRVERCVVLRKLLAILQQVPLTAKPKTQPPICKRSEVRDSALIVEHASHLAIETWSRSESAAVRCLAQQLVGFRAPQGECQRLRDVAWIGARLGGWSTSCLL
jgi:hypothetical protein